MSETVKKRLNRGDTLRKGPDGRWTLGDMDLSDGDSVELCVANEWISGVIKKQGIHYIFQVKGSKKSTLLTQDSKVRIKTP